MSERRRQRPKGIKRAIGRSRSASFSGELKEELEHELEVENFQLEHQLEMQEKARENYRLGRASIKDVLMNSKADIHIVSNPSLLDSRSLTPSYRGLYNLMFIVLVATNMRLVVENLLKYGILVQLPSADVKNWPTTWPALFTTVFVLPLFVVLAHFIEVAVQQKKVLSSKAADILHFINVCNSLFVPSVVIRGSVSTVGSGLFLILLSITLFMKLISFAHVMHCERTGIQVDGGEDEVTAKKGANGEKEEAEAEDDDNGKNKGGRLSFQHMWYFAFAPTLCYQHTYPRYPEKIRVRYVARRVTEILFCVVMISLIVQQWISPIMTNALRYMEGGMGTWHWGGFLERALKLSLPNLGLWLLIFFVLFHSWLNLLAELLRFGDRVFYRDWWNAGTMKDYWNRWNMPVHNWVLRHIYAPSIRNGVSSMHAQLLVFAVSAALHEVAVSIPLHAFKLWAFFGMLGQVPLVLLTEKFKKLIPNHNLWGNVLFWTVFCMFGQPVIILLYYHDVVTRSNNTMT